ncbi:hypothetical protein BDR05DRAFT_973495 [Suillus weaverae]|nr:hypothetical protein BDR05DRAFT_973495 [Suillus weaverae]
MPWYSVLSLECHTVQYTKHRNHINLSLDVLFLLPLSVLKFSLATAFAFESKTHENYGSGLLQFHQFCDSLSIAEDKYMPALETLLTAFIAHWAGKVAVTTADNWLAGLHFWHQFNNAPWHGNSLLRWLKAGLSKIVPDSSKHSHHPPVTIEHMHALFQNLNLSNSFDSAVYCMASIAFWCCCRLGELIVPSISMFDPTHHISRSAHTMHNDSADIVAMKIDDPTDPFTALIHHLSANSSVPPHAPFFAFETSDGWSPMTQVWFITCCNNIWASTGLPSLTGHCFHIGGATELLLCGTPPDIVAAQGRWKSCAFLDYWCCIESILPLFITNSSMDSYHQTLHFSVAS